MRVRSLCWGDVPVVDGTWTVGGGDGHFLAHILFASVETDETNTTKSTGDVLRAYSVKGTTVTLLKQIDIDCYLQSMDCMFFTESRGRLVGVDLQGMLRIYHLDLTKNGDIFELSVKLASTFHCAVTSVGTMLVPDVVGTHGRITCARLHPLGELLAVGTFTGAFLLSVNDQCSRFLSLGSMVAPVNGIAFNPEYPHDMCAIAYDRVAPYGSQVEYVGINAPTASIGTTGVLSLGCNNLIWPGDYERLRPQMGTIISGIVSLTDTGIHRAPMVDEERPTLLLTPNNTALCSCMAYAFKSLPRVDFDIARDTWPAKDVVNFHEVDPILDNDNILFKFRGFIDTKVVARQPQAMIVCGSHKGELTMISASCILSDSALTTQFWKNLSFVPQNVLDLDGLHFKTASCSYSESVSSVGRAIFVMALSQSGTVAVVTDDADILLFDVSTLPPFTIPEMTKYRGENRLRRIKAPVTSDRPKGPKGRPRKHVIVDKDELVYEASIRDDEPDDDIESSVSSVESEQKYASEGGSDDALAVDEQPQPEPELVPKRPRRSRKSQKSEVIAPLVAAALEQEEAPAPTPKKARPRKPKPDVDVEPTPQKKKKKVSMRMPLDDDDEEEDDDDNRKRPIDLSAAIGDEEAMQDEELVPKKKKPRSKKVAEQTIANQEHVLDLGIPVPLLAQPDSQPLPDAQAGDQTMPAPEEPPKPKKKLGRPRKVIPPPEPEPVDEPVVEQVPLVETPKRKRGRPRREEMVVDLGPFQELEPRKRSAPQWLKSP